MNLMYVCDAMYVSNVTYLCIDACIAIYVCDVYMYVYMQVI